MLEVVSGTREVDPPRTGRRSHPVPVVRPKPCSPITLLPSRTSEHAVGTAYSTRLLNSVSPFGLPPRRRTAQGPAVLVIDDESEVRRLVGHAPNGRRWSIGRILLPRKSACPPHNASRCAV
jgi:hypothetical protein